MYWKRAGGLSLRKGKALAKFDRCSLVQEGKDRPDPQIRSCAIYSGILNSSEEGLGKSEVDTCVGA